MKYKIHYFLYKFKVFFGSACKKGPVYQLNFRSCILIKKKDVYVLLSVTNLCNYAIFRAQNMSMEVERLRNHVKDMDIVSNNL